ncbi:hypothetical protein WG66_004613, partial [Moniliophthora roreri]
PEKIENKKREKKSQNERVKFGFGIRIKDQSSGDETGQEEDEHVLTPNIGYPGDEALQKDKAGLSTNV